MKDRVRENSVPEKAKVKSELAINPAKPMATDRAAPDLDGFFRKMANIKGTNMALMEIS